MPLNLLFCEGASGSPDVRILSTVLQGVVGEIRPSGAKYGLGNQILAYREAMQTNKIAGIIDGDFVDTWPPSEFGPRQWLVRGGTDLGWRWRRKEIENYLIDPIVVAGALGAEAPASEAYEALLLETVEAIAVYEAARTALSLMRSRSEPLPNCWGASRNVDKHSFPQDLSDEACRNAIEDTVTTHAFEHTVTVEQAIARYEQLFPEFVANGARKQNYLFTFAGKDLLIGMEAGLRNLGFRSSAAFREKIILGLERAGSAPVRDWIQEWASLAEAVQQFQ